MVIILLQSTTVSTAAIFIPHGLTLSLITSVLENRSSLHFIYCNFYQGLILRGSYNLLMIFLYIIEFHFKSLILD